MEENIDILAFLEQVMLENTHSYRSDFQLDIRKLTAAAQAPEAGTRLLLDVPPLRNMVSE